MSGTNWLILGGIAGLAISSLRTLRAAFKAANQAQRRAHWRFFARLTALVLSFLAFFVVFAKGYLPLWTFFAAMAAGVVLLVALIVISLQEIRAVPDGPGRQN